MLDDNEDFNNSLHSLQLKASRYVCCNSRVDLSNAIVPVFGRVSCIKPKGSSVALSSSVLKMELSNFLLAKSTKYLPVILRFET